MTKTTMFSLLLSWLILALWSSLAKADYRSTKVTVTAYNSVAWQTDSTPWIGACNIRLKESLRPIAVSRDLFEQGLDCGTKVALEGRQAEFVVMDKMNARWRKRIDLFMGLDIDRARRFGAKSLRIWWYDDGK